MVLTHAAHETVFSVLAEAARRRSTRSLAAQFTLTATAVTALSALAPQWWSVALLFGAFAAYAAWGLVTRALERPVTRLLAMGIAATGTVLAIVGTVGLAFTLFTGTAKGTYTPCGVGATSKMCRAWASPSPVSGPIR